MLAKVTVEPVYKLSGGFRLSGIKYRMPVEGFHEAAASLNYGAVHTGKAWMPSYEKGTNKRKEDTYRNLLGGPAKRSLKKFAVTGDITKRSRTAIQRDYKERLKPGATIRKGVTVFETPKQFGERTIAVGRTSKQHKSNTIWTSQAFTYWDLKPDQIAELNQLFVTTLRSELFAKNRGR
jgi:hypothetical protein